MLNAFSFFAPALAKNQQVRLQSSCVSVNMCVSVYVQICTPINATQHKLRNYTNTDLFLNIAVWPGPFMIYNHGVFLMWQFELIPHTESHYKPIKCRRCRRRCQRPPGAMAAN